MVTLCGPIKLGVWNMWFFRWCWTTAPNSLVRRGNECKRLSFNIGIAIKKLGNCEFYSSLRYGNQLGDFGPITFSQPNPSHREEGILCMPPYGLQNKGRIRFKREMLLHHPCRMEAWTEEWLWQALCPLPWSFLKNQPAFSPTSFCTIHISN